MSKRSIFCPNGHNKDIVGSYKSGRCKPCRKEYDKTRHSPHPRIKVQFCPKGHDTFVVGRTKSRGCAECQKYIPHPFPKKLFCIHGHEIAIVGRDKIGRCRGCLREKHPLKRGKEPKQFCPKGHNKDIVGKNKHGRCLLCQTEYVKEWNKKNEEHIKKRQKLYALAHREEKWEKEKQRLKTDINFRLRTRLRDRIIKAIKKNWKAGSAVRDLGCSIPFFKDYIENMFTGNMTWNNWGTVWQLDHIEELWKFDLIDREQFLVAVNYRNMQPLTLSDHYKKTAKEQNKREIIKQNKRKK